MIVFKEFLRSTVDLADLVGLHLVMTKVAGKGELKVLVAGVGKISHTMHVILTAWQTANKHERFCQTLNISINLLHVDLFFFYFRLGYSRAYHDPPCSSVGWS